MITPVLTVRRPLRWLAVSLTVAVAALASTPGTAKATLLTTMTVSHIGPSNLSTNNVNIGQNQIAIDVYGSTSLNTTATGVVGTNNVAIGENQVLFVFKNAGPARMTITDIFFEDGGLLSFASGPNDPFYYSNAGMSFAVAPADANFPSGGSLTPQFETSAGFTGSGAGSAGNPSPNLGINIGEALGILINLDPDKTGVDIVNALATRPAVPNSGTTIRIGLAVQNFPDGASGQFLNNPPGSIDPGPTEVIPEPSTLALAIGCIAPLAAIGVIRRRRQARADAA